MEERRRAKARRSGIAMIKKLMGQYRKAQISQRAKEKDSRDAAARTARLRLEIKAAIQANGIDVFRAVYAIQRPKDGKPIRLTRVAAGKNLRLTDLISASSTGHGGSPTPECGSACDHALKETDTQEMACICDCMETEAGPMTVVECIPLTGTFPE